MINTNTPTPKSICDSDREKLIICMVGLPARGKSYIAKHVMSYFQDSCPDELCCQLFNAGKERRVMESDFCMEKREGAGDDNDNDDDDDACCDELGYKKEDDHIDDSSLLRRTMTSQSSHDQLFDLSRCNSDFLTPVITRQDSMSQLPSIDDIVESDMEHKEQVLFDMDNQDSVNQRDIIAMTTLFKLCDYLKEDDGHRIGIFDATNTTKDRRQLIVSTIEKQLLSCKVVFLESICSDDDIVHQNILHKVYKSPDYFHNEDKTWCYQDFKSRLQNYEKVYETVTIKDEFEVCRIPSNISSIGCLKVVDKGEKLTYEEVYSPHRHCGNVPHVRELLRLLKEMYPQNDTLQKHESARNSKNLEYLRKKLAALDLCSMLISPGSSSSSLSSSNGSMSPLSRGHAFECVKNPEFNKLDHESHLRFVLDHELDSFESDHEGLDCNVVRELKYRIRH